MEETLPHSVPLHVNGRVVTIEIDDPGMPLLFALRNELDLEGPRFGCGLGQCGACTVLIDRDAVRSCVISVSALTPSQEIVTLEGLGSPERPHPVQQAFIGEAAVECGYCINGMIMQSAALFAKTRHPSAAEIRDALANNVCRCGTLSRILRAVQRAAAR